MKTPLSLLLPALVLVATAAPAATNAEKCAAAKIKATAKLSSCALGADSKALLKGLPSDRAKCIEKHTGSFANAEAKYPGECPTTGDTATVQGEAIEVLDCVAGGLSGTPGACDVDAASRCGNGVIDGDEVCDQGDLGGATCGSATSGVKNVGTLRCGTDCSSFDTSQCLTCPATDSAAIGGTCWILGAAGASCDAACGAAGLAYSPATVSAGSGGTLSSCASVLDTLGAAADYVQNSGPTNGIGCNWTGSSFYWRSSPVTNSFDFYPTSRRACACM